MNADRQGERVLGQTAWTRPIVRRMLPWWNGDVSPIPTSNLYST